MHFVMGKTVFVGQALALAAAIAATVALAGCAKPPEQEMAAAADAVARAENDGNAVTYAAATLNRARQLLARMRSESDAGRYDAAKGYAAEVVALAERAIAEGRTGAERADREAGILIQDILPRIIETGQGISSARNSGLALDFDELDRDYETAVGNAERASTAYNLGQYSDVLIFGQSARNVLMDISSRIAIAATAVPTSKK